MALDLLPTTISNSPLGGLFNYDVLTQVIYYSNSNATGNYQINFRGDSVTSLASVVPVGNTLRTLLFVQNGPTAYYLTSVTVDGFPATAIGWLKRLPEPGPSNNISSYEINITQTSAGVFTIF